MKTFIKWYDPYLIDYYGQYCALCDIRDDNTLIVFDRDWIADSESGEIVGQLVIDNNQFSYLED